MDFYARHQQAKLDGFSKSVYDMHKKMRRLERQYGAGLNTVKDLGKASAVTLGAMAYGIKGAVQEAMRFEDAMADVKKVIDFDSPKGVKEFRGELERLSTELPIAFDGLAKIAAAAGQSGIAKDEIIAFTESAAKMGVAFDISADEAGQAMAEMRTAFKMNQSEVETLADKINYLGNTSPNAADKILSVVQRVGAIGEVAGLSSDHIAAMAASVVGIDDSIVGTGIKNIALRLTAGTAATKQQKAAFEALGMSATQVAKDMQTDAIGTIQRVVAAIGAMPEHEQAAMTKLLVGDEALPVMAQMITNAENLADNIKAVGDASVYAGSMQGEYEARAATLSNSLDTFGNQFTLLKASIGEAFAPAVAALVESLKPVISSITTWVKENPTLITTITAITATVLALVAGLGGLAVAFFAVSGGLSALAGLLSLAAGVFGLLSAPVLLVVAALAAVGYAAYKLYQNWEEISNAIGEIVYHMVEDVKEKLKFFEMAVLAFGAYITDTIVGAWEAITTAVSVITLTMVQVVSERWQAVKSSAVSAWQSIKDSIKSGVDNARQAIEMGFNALPAPVQTALSMVGSVVQAHFKIIKTLFTTTFSVIKALVRGDMDGVKTAISTGMQAAWEIVKGLLGDIMTAFGRLGSELTQAGKNAIQGFINGVKGKMSEALSSAKELAGQVASTIKNVFVIRSPSRLMRAYGGYIAEGLALGINDKTAQAVRASKNMAKQVRETIAGEIASLKRELALFGNDDPLVALGYDIGVGKYGGQNTSQLQALTAELSMRKANQAVLSEISRITHEMATAGKSRLEILDYEINHTDKYKHVLADNLTAYREIVASNEQLNELLKERERFNSNTDGLKNTILDLEKQITLFGNNSPFASERYDLARLNADGDTKARVSELYTILGQMQSQEATKNAFDDMVKGVANQSPIDKLQADYAEKMRIVQEFEDTHTGITEQSAKARADIEQAYATAKRDLLLTQGQELFSGLAGMAESFAGKQSGIYRAMFAVEKGFAIAQASIAMSQAMSQGLAKGFPAGLGDMAMAAVQGAKIISAIKSVVMPVGQAHDGIMSVPKSGTWNLEKGERVLPRHTAQNLDNTLSSIQGGGVKVVINNYTGEKTDVQQMPNGDMMITIGKMMQDVGRQQAQQVVREELAQGGSISRRLR